MIKTFFSDVLYFGIVNSLTRIMPLIALFFLTHYFSPSEMGIIESCTAFFLIISVFGMCQMDTALQRYFNDFGNDVVFFTVIFTSIASIIVGGLSFFSITIFQLNELVKIYDLYLVFLVCLMPLYLNLSLLLSLILRYQFETKFQITFMNIAQVFVFFILVLNGYRNNSLSITDYFSYLMISYALSIIIGSYFLLKKDSIILEKMSLSLSFSTNKKVINFSFPQIPARIISIISQQGNRFMIIYLLGITSLGIFSVSGRMALIYGVVLNAFNLVWYPMLYGKKIKLNESKMIFNYIIIILMFISPILCVLSWFIYYLYIDELFHEGIVLSWLLLYSSSNFIIKEMLDTPIKIYEKTSYISLTYVFYIIVLFSSIIFFSNTFGLLGVGIATYLSSSLMLFFSWYLSKEKFNFSYSFLMIVLYIIVGILMFFLLGTLFDVL